MRQVTKGAPTLRPSARWPRPARLFLGLALTLLALITPHAAASGGSAQNSSAAADQVAVKYDGITYLPITFREDETVYVPEPFTPQNLAELLYKGEYELKANLPNIIAYFNEGTSKQTTIKEVRPMLTKTQYVEYLVDVYRKMAEGKKGLPSTKEELEEWFEKYGPVVYATVGPGDPRSISYEGKVITLIAPIDEIQPGYIWGMAARERTETSEVVEVGMTYMIKEVGTAIKQITLKTNNEKPWFRKEEEELMKKGKEIEDIFWEVEEMRGYGNEDSKKIAASLFDGVAYIPIGIIEINGIGYAFPTAPMMYDIRHFLDE